MSIQNDVLGWCIAEVLRLDIPIFPNRIEKKYPFQALNFLCHIKPRSDSFPPPLLKGRGVKSRMSSKPTGRVPILHGICEMFFPHTMANTVFAVSSCELWPSKTFMDCAYQGSTSPATWLLCHHRSEGLLVFLTPSSEEDTTGFTKYKWDNEVGVHWPFNWLPVQQMLSEEVHAGQDMSENLMVGGSGLIEQQPCFFFANMNAVPMLASFVNSWSKRQRS